MPLDPSSIAIEERSTNTQLSHDLFLTKVGCGEFTAGVMAQHDHRTLKRYMKDLLHHVLVVSLLDWFLHIYYC